MPNTTKIGYIGNVTLSYKVKDKVVRVKKFNKGWSNLFRFIARCLTDNMSNVSKCRPCYVDIKCRHRSGDTWGSWVSCLYERVDVTPSFTYAEDPEMEDYGAMNYTSTFTATIASTTINRNELEKYDENDECAIFLISNEGNIGKNVLTPDTPYRMAQLNLSVDSLKSVVAGTQVIVEWVMEFFNR